MDISEPIRAGEELDLPRLEAHLRPLLPDARGEFTALQFRKGHSNLTYHLRFGEQEYVLRRPPFGNPVKSAHDMGREFRVLSKLWEVYPPAPRPFVYCQDASVIGDEFYVMERRHGIVLRSASVPGLSTHPEAVQKLCESLVDNLVALHSLDYGAAGLGDVGHPEGYIERQVTGWNKRYANARTEACPNIEQLGDWLMQHRPADGPSAFLHNDYKYDNLMLDPLDVTRIVAVLDWEMATVGDPLMDLGMTLAYWVQSDDSEDQRLGAFGPTALPGSFTRQEVVTRYAERAGKRVPNMLFYYCFGLFKLAVIIQQIYARFARGLTQDPRFAGLNTRVQSLGAAGIKAIESGEI